MSLCDACGPTVLALIREGRDPIQTVNELRRWAIVHDTRSRPEPEPPTPDSPPPGDGEGDYLVLDGDGPFADPFYGMGGEDGDASPVAGGE